MSAHRAASTAPPSFAVLLTVLMMGQALGTMATSILPAVAPKVVETFAIGSALIAYQVSLISLSMLVSLVFGGHLSVRWGGCRVSQVGLTLCVLGCSAGHHRQRLEWGVSC
jgi:MFS family permease